MRYPPFAPEGVSRGLAGTGGPFADDAAVERRDKDDQDLEIAGLAPPTLTATPSAPSPHASATGGCRARLRRILGR
jgi:hypothetical protein